MPPTNDERGGKSRLGHAGLPDRDNPLAWKRKVAEGRLGAKELLTTLTDEEVGRYMAVAKDQVRIEERYKPVKITSALAGAVLMAAVIVLGLRSGFDRQALAGLGLGLAMVYWPWRAMKCRELWLKHFAAAKAEIERRAQMG